MTVRRLTECFKIDKNWLDLSIWPKVLYDEYTPDVKEKFLLRKKAVELYIKNEIKVSEISSITGLSRYEIIRLVKRCLQDDGTGLIWGFRALIPQKRVNEYTRKDISSNATNKENTNYAGSFRLLMDKYPAIKEKITNYYLGRCSNRIIDNRMSIKYLHKHFIEECRSIGIEITEYPFNTQDKGRRSLYRYVKNIENSNFSESAKRYNNEASRHAKTTGIGTKNYPMVARPYERVQFDGHRIDVMISITYKTPAGDERTDVLDRIWLLVIIDVATRAILGHYICLKREYNAVDVIQCIKNAVKPKVLKSFTIPSLKYPSTGGFPSVEIPELQWALWDEFYYDNAKANLSSMVIDRLTHIVGCSVNAGPVNMPERRALVERFFGVLEENGFHRLPSTTGSHPKDVRRKNPEKNAVNYKITSEHIEELTEVLIANYNVTPHEGNNNLTPIECMKQRVLRGLYPRCMPQEQQDEIAFLTMRDQRVVVGDIKSGKRPYINYEGAEYRNDVLSRSPNLIGTKLDLLINIDDIRVIRAFLPDGSEFGLLTASGKWGVIPHSLQQRKQINSLKNQKLIHFTNMDDPIEIYQRYLETTASNSKAQRTKLAELRRKKVEMKSTTHELYNHNHESKSESAIRKTEEINDIEQAFNNLNFKTFTY